MTPRKRFWLCVFGIVLITAVVGGWVYVRSPKFLCYPDAMEYASVARNLARGQGATSQALWVLRLAFSAELPAAEVRRPLLFPFWLSVLFRLFGAKDVVAILGTAFWWAMLIGLTFCFAYRFFSLEVAVWGALLLLFDKGTLTLAFSGLTEPLFAVLLLLAVWVLLESKSPIHFIAVGVLLGLAQWTRANAFFYLFPALIFVGGKNRQVVLTRVLCLMAGFFVVCLPIAFRNYQALGSFSLNPLYSYAILNSTPLATAHGMERSLLVHSPLAYFLANPGVLWTKWSTSFVNNFTILGDSLYPIMLGVILIGLLRAKAGREAKLGLFILSSLLLTVVLFSLGEYEGIRFYVPWAPLLIVQALGFVFSNGLGTSWRSRLASSVLLAITVVMTSATVASLHPRPRALDFYRAVGDRVKENVSTEQVVLTDCPWITGWHADRTAVWLPNEPETVGLLMRELPISALALMPTVQQSDEFSRKWKAIYAGEQGFAGFRRLEWREAPGVVFFVAP